MQRSRLPSSSTQSKASSSSKISHKKEEEENPDAVGPKHARISRQRYDTHRVRDPFGGGSSFSSSSLVSGSALSSASSSSAKSKVSGSSNSLKSASSSGGEKSRTGASSTASSSRIARGKSSSSPFQKAYQAGLLNCHLGHTSTKMHVTWQVAPMDLDYNPLLITFFQGLVENDHPYCTISRLGIRDLLESPGAEEKTVVVLPEIVAAIRNALLGNAEIFLASLDAIQQLSRCVGPALDEYLHLIAAQIGKKMFNKKLAPKIEETLQCLEENGGPEATSVIRSKVPTYTSIVS